LFKRATLACGQPWFRTTDFQDPFREGWQAQGTVRLYGPCCEVPTLAEMPFVEVMRKGDKNPFLNGDGTLRDGVDQYRVQAALVEEETNPVAQNCFLHKAVTVIGPITEVIEGTQGNCVKTLIRGLVGRQLDAAKEGRSCDPETLVEVERVFFEDLEKRYAENPPKGPFRFWDVEEWATKHTGSKMGKRFAEESWKLFILEAMKANSTIDLFGKCEFQGKVDRGAQETEFKLNRVISNQRVDSKLPFIGVIHVIIAFLGQLYPEYASKKSPEAQDADLADYLNARAPNGDLSGLSAAAMDFSKMDSSFVLAVKRFVERIYYWVLKKVFDDISNTDAEARVAEFKRVLDARTARKFQVPGAFGIPAWTMWILATVDSGAFDTAVMDWLISMACYVYALHMVITLSQQMADLNSENCNPKTGSSLYTQLIGDDSMIIGPSPLPEAVAGEYAAVASKLGFKVTAEGSNLVGEDNRVSFCSRVFLLARRGDKWLVKGIREPARILARIGVTCKSGINSGEDRRRLMVAVALCELFAARAPDGSSVPVLGALAQGILESPRCSGLEAKFDEDTARRFLMSKGREVDKAHYVRMANRESRSQARRLPQPSVEMRQAFYDYTGVSPTEQQEVEKYLLGATQRGRTLLSHPVLTRLLRDA
jgi:hypothetical protein